MSGTRIEGIQMSGTGGISVGGSLAVGQNARAETTLLPAARTSGPELALLIRDLRTALRTAAGDPADTAAAASLADASAVAVTLAQEVQRPDITESRLRQLLHRVTESAGCITSVAQAVTAIRTALNLT